MKVIKLNRKTLEIKQIVFWNANDNGYAKHKGSIYFNDNHYMGFLNHDDSVKIIRNLKPIGTYKFSTVN